MAQYHESKPVNAQSMSATWTSRPIDCRSATLGMLLHIISGSAGSPVGAYTIEGSNDERVEDDYVRGTSTASWVDITTLATQTPSSSFTVAGAVNCFAKLSTIPKWIRVKYTRTSGGTGTATVYAFGSS